MLTTRTQTRLPPNWNTLVALIHFWAQKHGHNEFRPWAWMHGSACALCGAWTYIHFYEGTEGAKVPDAWSFTAALGCAALLCFFSCNRRGKVETFLFGFSCMCCNVSWWPSVHLTRASSLLMSKSVLTRNNRLSVSYIRSEAYSTVCTNKHHLCTTQTALLRSGLPDTLPCSNSETSRNRRIG